MDPTAAPRFKSPLSRFQAEERAYLSARFFLMVALSVIYALGVARDASPLDQVLYLCGLGLFAADTLALVAMVFGAKLEVRLAMLFLLAPELAGAAILTYLGRPADLYYAVIVLGPIFYALVVSKRHAIIVSFAVTGAYIIGLVAAGPETTVSLVMTICKVLVVPAVGYLVATAVSRQRYRERTAEDVAAETERLNLQLRQRVDQLQAVSAITEIIHSSLDLDEVGGQILDIIAETIGASTCCVFVIDKDRSETLFSASRGTAVPISDPARVEALADIDDQHLTCVPVFDHGAHMVLFCTTGIVLAHLTDEERMMLGAISSELVVAVENSRLYKLTRRLAVTDELTGLANYRQLQTRLDDEVARSARYGKSVSLIMIDADGFKAYNDRYGHVAGDAALADLGTIMRKLVREVDLVARYGGEEFSVVLPETDTAGAYVVAEKIREAVELHRFPDADGRRACQLTISAGVATCPNHGSDRDSLLRESDDALYHAKNNGKNRVRAAQTHEHRPANAAEQETGSAAEPVQPTGV